MKNGNITCLIALISATAAFGMMRSAHAQAPTTLSEIKSILDQAASTSREIKKAEGDQAKVDKRGKAWHQRLLRHNANPCTYPEGHPEKCAQYEREKESLEVERTTLLEELRELDGRKGTLKSRFGMLMARLRIGRLLGALQEWLDNDVIPCTNLPPMTAKPCLDNAWEKHP